AAAGYPQRDLSRPNRNYGVGRRRPCRVELGVERLEALDLLGRVTIVTWVAFQDSFCLLDDLGPGVGPPRLQGGRHNREPRMVAGRVGSAPAVTATTGGNALCQRNLS